MSSVQSFYHYTSTAGACGIRDDEVLRSQNGVKLSTLKPEDYSRDDILRSMYGKTIPPEFKNRADNVVSVDKSNMDASKLRKITPTLYRYSGEIKVSANDVKDKPACNNRGSSWGTSTKSSSSGSNGSGSSSSDSQDYPQTMYHYTNQSTANSIISSRYIPFNGNVFLTTMKPSDYFRDEILKIIYGKSYDRKQYAAFADWCIKVDVTELDANKLNRSHSKVYEYAGYIQVDPSDVMDKPICNKSGQNQR